MSTDIVRFQTGNDGQTQKVFQLDALQLFLAICLPMMAVVFVAWYGVYWWVNQEEAGQRQRRLNVSEQV
jgi:nitrate reductase NapE component